MKEIFLMAGTLLLCFLTNLGHSQTNTTTFFVNGVCGMCETRIEKAALQVKGIKQAEWKVDEKLLTVKFNPKHYNEDVLHQAIADVGHDTKKYTATDEAYESLHACCKYRDAEVIDAHQPKTDSDEFFVNGVCDMCKTRIEKAALEVAGIKEANWDVEKKLLSVNTDPQQYNQDILQQAMAAVGHDTENYTATDEAYESLHNCCKYRDPKVLNAHQPKAEKVNRPSKITGVILVEEDGKNIPLPGVNVYWVDQNAISATDKKGNFSLDRPEGADLLVASYVGYYTDTIALTNETSFELVLTPGTVLDEVEVAYRRKSIEVSFIAPMLVQKIDSKELLKAACCTLAESFETNPAVDVSFTDAVTGARQIEMLGLAGPNMQITRENVPDIRGLSAIYGLSYLPGPWIESIQLAKGVGSVANGFESITGQINVELKKPEEGERFYFNLYGNEGGRLEGNANTRLKVSENWNTSFMVHGNLQNSANDRNNDGFLDMPTGNEWTVLNRWKFSTDEGWNSQFGLKVTNFDKTSGQLTYEEEGNPQAWGADILTNRIEGWAKLGKVFLNRPERSVGFQISGIRHDQEANFGLTPYDAEQQSLYANLMYQDIIGSTVHRIRTGLSWQIDNFQETLGQSLFKRNESVPGAFAEYTYEPSEKLTAVAGLRADHHNQFGAFLTPRLHMRYALSPNSVMRLSAGMGRRTASIIAENLGMLASSRSIIIDESSEDVPYGLNQEVATNLGLSLRQTFQINNRELVLTLDGFHTRFQQQVVVDYDQSARTVLFYNLDGKSWSNSLQAQVDYALLKNFDVRVAYRFNDVQADYRSGRLERPFVSRHRAFINLSYETDNGWAFDYTLNWQGAKRLPSTVDNPIDFQIADRSPDFVLSNAQISKRWSNKFDIYLGVENLFNFVQENPILGANDPFGDYFDSSLVWGPIFGRMVYAGVRYTIE